MCLSPLHARLETAYKTKKKRIGNQHQGPGIDGERAVNSGRAKIRQLQKETSSGCYDTPLKYKAKLIIGTPLNTTVTTEDHRAVADVIKKWGIEGDAAPSAKTVCLKKEGNQR